MDTDLVQRLLIEGEIMTRSELKMLLLGLILVQTVFAYEDLGPIDKVRQSHPYIFVPNEVNIVKIGNAENYVFSGQAEKNFDDETDSELWQEATLAAKNTFYQWITKGDVRKEVSMSGCAPFYRDKNGKVYNMIMSVPCANVRITNKISSGSGNVGNGATRTVDLGVDANAVIAKAESDNKVGGDIGEGASNPLDKDALRSLVAEHPDDWPKRRQLAELYFSEGNMARGFRHFQEALRIARQDGKVTKKEIAIMTYELAVRSDEMNKENLAIKYYRQVLHLDATDEMRNRANERIAQLLLKINGLSAW